MRTIERRRFDRVPMSLELHVTNLATGRIHPGRSVDICRLGVGFFADSFLTPGTHVRLCIHFKSNGQERRAYILATIVHSRMEGSGAVMGAAFDSELGPSNQPEFCELIDRW